MVWARVKGGQVLVVVVAVPNALARWSGRVTCASALLPPRRRVCSHSLVCCRQQQPPSPLLKGRTQGGGRWWRRGLSSDSSIRNTHQEEANKFRPVKTMLNRLYLIVHPDLFADRPKEQARPPLPLAPLPRLRLLCPAGGERQVPPVPHGLPRRDTRLLCSCCRTAGLGGAPQRLLLPAPDCCCC